ncbi:hypothetical protein M409DRAFT_25710 [Zasmidium cellare ATCC 36951]|uniref:Hydrophobin n=1 Tax=Zasmidium cellare ATCC 36951 TaxID=1080233 RepID=A0A6A6CAV1_ZASCE|nr:uncharacterized protein M409DRAFT_25710 [Zasmidium cellare ATCC 36951]KAF2163933.1 hypothetical protein M409DRAFT_25710 [Zasmidium cellare ATCC 36951]
MFCRRLPTLLLNLSVLALATPETYPPWQKPHCKHPSVVSCCESFFTGNDAPPGLGINLACFDLGPTDLQCVYSETNGKAYDYCIGTWACCEVDVLSTVAIHCTTPANGGACAGFSVSDCTNVGVRWPSCLWGPSLDVGANAFDNVLGDTVVDRIHSGGKPSGPH